MQRLPTYRGWTSWLVSVHDEDGFLIDTVLFTECRAERPSIRARRDRASSARSRVELTAALSVLEREVSPAKSRSPALRRVSGSHTEPLTIAGMLCSGLAPAGLATGTPSAVSCWCTSRSQVRPDYAPLSEARKPTGDAVRPCRRRLRSFVPAGGGSRTRAPVSRTCWRRAVVRPAKRPLLSQRGRKAGMSSAFRNSLVLKSYCQPKDATRRFPRSPELDALNEVRQTSHQLTVFVAWSSSAGTCTPAGERDPAQRG